MLHGKTVPEELLKRDRALMLYCMQSFTVGPGATKSRNDRAWSLAF